MSDWVLTKGLQHLRNQVDYFFPDRSKASDGTIGDAAHMAEPSGHNPDDTPGSKAEYNDHDGIREVRAWDCTSNFGSGVDAQLVVDHLRALPRLSSVIRYMIYNRWMYHERDGFAPTPYTGASPHTEHIHFSGAFIQSADNDTTFDYRLEEIPVALTDADKNWLQAELAAAVWAYKVDVDRSAAGKNMQPAGSVLAYGSGEHHDIMAGVTAVAKDVAAVKTDVEALKPAKA